MRHVDRERRVAELDNYRREIEQAAEKVRGADAGLNRTAVALAFELGITVGVAGSYFVAGEQLTNIIFCKKDAVRAWCALSPVNRQAPFCR